GDELLFLDGQSRRQPLLVIVSRSAQSVRLRITGHLIPVTDLRSNTHGRATESAADDHKADQFWTRLCGSVTIHPPASGPQGGDALRLQEILPWFAHNAMVHYLAPRGLEQYSGGGWGTRDVCQGPVEMLLALAQWAPLRDLLLRV